jgi:glucose/arabinose dehydrogenase
MNSRLLKVCVISLTLLSAGLAAQTVPPTGTPPGVKPIVPDKILTDFNAVQAEGQPIERRPPEKADDKPAFHGQTRAPFHRTAPFNVKILTEKLRSPWSFAFLPDGKILITEKPGSMRLLDSNGALSEPVAGVPAVFNFGQVGLLDVALDRDFAANHRIFFTYSELVGDTDSNIVVARAIFDEAANALEKVDVIFRARPALPAKTVAYNQGGRIAIGRDGNLFVTIGDRSNSPPWDMAQRLDTHLGKIIHITPDGAPAAGNPFIGKAGALPEIWSYGHRSQEGLTIHPVTGQLWESENGPRGGDKLLRPRPGANYGWPVIVHGIDYPGEPIGQGITEKEGFEQPLYYWDPVIAPSGMAFYTGNLFPQWKGSVFIGALRGRMLDRLSLSGDKVVNEEPLLLVMHNRVRDVRIGPEGAVYVLTDDGKLLQLTPK